MGAFEGSLDRVLPLIGRPPDFGRYCIAQKEICILERKRRSATLPLTTEIKQYLGSHSPAALCI